jgi:hypothetical protein
VPGRLVGKRSHSCPIRSIPHRQRVTVTRASTR